MHAVNASPAALFRAVADEAGRPTILFDEIDTVFGPKAKDNEDLRGLLNAGHRKSGVSYRCVGDGGTQTVVAFPSYCAVALGGLGSLPDTILARSVIIRMRRRARNEHVEPFRARIHEPQGHALRDQLTTWAEQVRPRVDGAFPDMPEGITDRPADVWEPLLAVADAAGGTWPDRARQACVDLVTAVNEDDRASLGVKLLTDLRDHVFPGEDTVSTIEILHLLNAMEESPWGDLDGRPLNARTLSKTLKEYVTGKGKPISPGPCASADRSSRATTATTSRTPGTATARRPRNPRLHRLHPFHWTPDLRRTCNRSGRCNRNTSSYTALPQRRL